jgi:hypothetical protein
MSWFKTSEKIYHGFFSIKHAMTSSFCTMKQPNGNIVHVTHIYEPKDVKLYDPPVDAIYVGIVVGGIIEYSSENKYKKTIPIINGEPIRDFYDLTKTSSQRSFHGFFSLSQAKENGFATVLDLDGKEIDVTRLLGLKSKKFIYDLMLVADSVYIGVVSHTIVRTKPQNFNEGNIPKINGRPVEGWS